MILGRALDRLTQHGDDPRFVLRFLPGEFTMREYQLASECVLGRPLDKRNFRKKALATGQVRATDRFRRDGAHRPARLYERIPE